MNIYDIAREAGVSIATVSRVINRPEAVAASTRARVETVMKQHRYNPDAVARGLSGAGMKTIGVLAEDSRVPYYAHITWAVEQESRRNGYSVILCNTGRDTADQKHYLDILKAKRVDALIAAGSLYQARPFRKALTAFAEEIPVVMINGQFKAAGVRSILCDDGKGMSLCVDHMAEKGYRDLIYLCYGSTVSSLRKLEGFREGVRRNGLPGEDGRILYCEEAITSGMDAARRILEGDIPCRGIVCEDTILAAGVMKILEKAGRRIPEDFALSGYNSTYISDFLMPELTSVDGKIDFLGITAVRSCIDILEGGSPPAVLEAEPELVAGSTT